MPKKSVDDVEDVYEMLGLFKLLHIEHDPNAAVLSNMQEQAKKKIGEQSSGSGKYSNGTTVTSYWFLYCIYFIYITSYLLHGHYNCQFIPESGTESEPSENFKLSAGF